MHANIFHVIVSRLSALSSLQRPSLPISAGTPDTRSRAHNNVRLDRWAPAVQTRLARTLSRHPPCSSLNLTASQMDYEAERRARIAANQAMLASLAIQPLAIPDKPKKPRKVRVDESKKRGTKRDEPPASSEESVEERPAKAAKVEEDDGNARGLRRSTRNRGKEEENV